MDRETVQEGDSVKIHFTGKTAKKQVIATSQGGEPVEFVVGQGKFIPGLEKGIIGMAVGEYHKYKVPPEEGFGIYRQELVTTVKKSAFPETIPPEKGKELMIRNDQGMEIEARITEIEGDDVTVNANHPLAGQSLHLEVEVVSIQKDNRDDSPSR